MAGNTIDERADRIEYDLDGTLIYYHSGSFTYPDPLTTLFSNAQLRQLNDSNNVDVVISGGANSVQKFMIVFAEPMTITGYYLGAHCTGGGAAAWINYSTNSTNGVDGTWLSTGWTYFNSGDPNYMKNNVLATNLTNVKYIIGYWQTGASSSPSTSLRNIQIYGYPTAGKPTRRLEFWHPTTDAEASAALFDYAEQPQGATVGKTFRVKNMSATETANAIVVSAGEVMKDATPTLATQVSVSTDDITYTSTINIGNLAPGAISPVLYHRWAIPSNAQFLLQSLRVSAIAGSWT